MFSTVQRTQKKSENSLLKTSTQKIPKYNSIGSLTSFSEDAFHEAINFSALNPRPNPICRCFLFYFIFRQYCIYWEMSPWEDKWKIAHFVVTVSSLEKHNIPEKQNNAVLEKDSIKGGVSIYLQLLIEWIEFKYNLSNKKWENRVVQNKTGGKKEINYSGPW